MYLFGQFIATDNSFLPWKWGWSGNEENYSRFFLFIFGSKFVSDRKMWKEFYFKWNYFTAIKHWKAENIHDDENKRKEWWRERKNIFLPNKNSTQSDLKNQQRNFSVHACEFSSMNIFLVDFSSLITNKNQHFHLLTRKNFIFSSTKHFTCDFIKNLTSEACRKFSYCC